MLVRGEAEGHVTLLTGSARADTLLYGDDLAVSVRLHTLLTQYFHTRNVSYQELACEMEYVPMRANVYGTLTMCQV